MSQTTFLSDMFTGGQIPAGKLAYFQARLSNLLHEAILAQFTKLERESGFTRADLARRIGRKPEQVTRWFGSPGNWTLETVSDLLLAMGCELEPKLKELLAQIDSQVVTQSKDVAMPQSENFRHGLFQLDDSSINLIFQDNGVIYSVSIPLTSGMTYNATTTVGPSPIEWPILADMNRSPHLQPQLEQQSLSQARHLNTLNVPQRLTAPLGLRSNSTIGQS